MKKKQTRKINVLALVTGIFLSIYVVSLLVPLIWGFTVSLKSTWSYIAKGPFGFSFDFSFENYGTVFKVFKATAVYRDGSTKTVYFEGMLLNSVLYAIGCALSQTVCTAIVAYTTSKFPFKFSKVIYVTVLITMIMPIVGSMPSEIQMAQALGIYNTFIGMIIMKFSFLGMYYLVLYEAFKGVPKEMREAALVDGASNIRIFLQIMVPLVKSMILTIFLLYFVIYWNDYQIPMIYLKSRPTLSLGLFKYTTEGSSEVSNTPAQLAGCFAVFIPIFILFLVFHKRFMNPVDVGGIKE